MWSSSSIITCSTILVCPDESSTIMGPNSSAKHSRGSVTNSGFKVCHQWHTIQPLIALQKPLTRLLGSFSRIHLKKSTRLRRQIRRMLMGLQHNDENPEKPCRFSWCTDVKLYSHWRSRFIFASCPTSRILDEEKHRLRLQELKVLYGKHLQVNNKSSSIKLEFPEPSKKSQRIDFQERRPFLSSQKTHGHDS